jgi:hypothetical protein
MDDLACFGIALAFGKGLIPISYYPHISYVNIIE